MQIKRRLSAIAKRFGNEVEALNISIELNRICDRLEELADYADAKLERIKQLEKTGKGLHDRAEEKIKERREEIARLHAEDAAEAAKDQEDAREEFRQREAARQGAGTKAKPDAPKLEVPKDDVPSKGKERQPVEPPDQP